LHAAAAAAFAADALLPAGHCLLLPPSS